MIQLEEVSKYYKDVIALENISLSIEKGEMAFLTGPSGAGKSTLLKLLYREEKPDKGKIILAGWDLGKVSGSTMPYLRRAMGIIFQDFRLLRKKSVYDNVALALKIRGLPRRVINTRTKDILRKVALLHKANIQSQYLSGGEQQRVAIARAMVTDPIILLADEPTGNLDQENSSIIIELIKMMNARGTTVIIATHQNSLFKSTGKRVFHLKEGRLIRETIG
ncbi:MAG: cell division ATP-binding protein FtsE [Nitrospirae bacterium]|nr:MAG: cell division ATP-binding protein FtsE [Nitrospirota bacterium]